MFLSFLTEGFTIFDDLHYHLTTHLILNCIKLLPMNIIQFYFSFKFVIIYKLNNSTSDHLFV